MIMLKMESVLFKIHVKKKKKGISKLLRQVAAKHTANDIFLLVSKCLNLSSEGVEWRFPHSDAGDLLDS